MDYEIHQTPGKGRQFQEIYGYNIGSWTPELLFGGASTGISYNGQIGRYIRLGNMVMLNYTISLTSKGSATGGASVSGIPHKVDFGGNYTGATLWTNMTTPIVHMVSYARVNGTAIELWGNSAAATSLAQLQETDFSGTTFLNGTVSFLIQPT